MKPRAKSLEQSRQIAFNGMTEAASAREALQHSSRLPVFLSAPSRNDSAEPRSDTKKHEWGKPTETTRFVMSVDGDGANGVGFFCYPLMIGLSAGTIQLNHEGTRRNTNGKPPENARFIMSLKGADADDVELSAFPLRIGLSALNSQLHRSGSALSSGLSTA